VLGKGLDKMTRACYNHSARYIPDGLRKPDASAGVLLMKSQQRRTQMISGVTPLWAGRLGAVCF
jgi:hypothetical protein